MKKKILNTMLALTVAIATVAGSTMPAMAAEQEVTGTGTDTQTQDVEVTADIQSVYSVSLPATIELNYGVVESRNGSTIDGYWSNIKYGVAGKIAADEVVNVVPQYPCTLTLMDSDGNPTETTIAVYDSRSAVNGWTYNEDNYQCKTAWNKSEIGSCDYDGVSLSNCAYSYCCEGHYIGINSGRIEKYGNYAGNLTFQFSITKQ